MVLKTQTTARVAHQSCRARKGLFEGPPLAPRHRPRHRSSDLSRLIPRPRPRLLPPLPLPSPWQLNPEAKPPKIFKPTLNGSNTHKLFDDAALMEDQDLDSLPVGCKYNSLFIDTIRDTLIRLDKRDALQELHECAKMHRCWGIALQAGYRVRPTAQQVETFVEYIRRYSSFPGSPTRREPASTPPFLGHGVQPFTAARPRSA